MPQLTNTACDPSTPENLCFPESTASEKLIHTISLYKNDKQKTACGFAYTSKKRATKRQQVTCIIAALRRFDLL